ncbi:MAG: Spy/CpxP family protein refolding chaperone [Hyphomicrobiaceae bacterium]
MNYQSILSTSVLSLGLVLSGPAFGQSSHEGHHPEDKSSQSETKNSVPIAQCMTDKGMMRGDVMEMMAKNCPMMSGGSAKTHPADRLAFIKAELAITEVQQTAWNVYAAALEKNLNSMKKMRAGMMKHMKAMKTKSSVEWLSSHISMMEGRLAVLKETKSALEILYHTLNEEQKNKANKLLTGMGG